MMSGLQGGKFWSGFASGALSSIANSVWGADFNGKEKAGLGWASKIRTNDVAQLAFGTVMGGAGSQLTGGNFWQGAATGFMVSSLNHLMHKIGETRALESYKSEIETTIDNRIKEIESKITSGDYKEEIVNDLNIQKSILENFKAVKLPFLLSAEHDTSINLVNKSIPTASDGFEASGQVHWGNTSTELLVIHDGNIDTIIHELSHTFDIIKGLYRVQPFVANSAVGFKTYYSEIHAYRMSYSLGKLNGVSNINQINEQFIINRGY
jgi:hypothetical protein